MTPTRTLLPLSLLTLPSLAGCEPDVPFDECTEPFAAHTAQDSPYLHQDGTQLVDGGGQPVVLKTVNFGGWLHFESWMFGAELNLLDLSQGSESQLLGRVEELYGTAARTRFLEAIHEGFGTEADFQQIAALGFDSIRLPINHTLLEDSAGWAHLDAAVEWAGKHDLTLIIDMHAAPGGQSAMFMADPDATLLWDDPAAQDELVADWTAIAARYADSAQIAGYDLLNEPDPSDPAQLLSLYDRLIPAIRAQDPSHLLFIEGSSISREFGDFTRRLDDNMAYSPHVYLWFGYPDQAWLDSLSLLSTCHDTPVWVGEFGEDRVDQIKALREGFDQLSGWAIWPWKKVDVGGEAGVGEIDAPAEWMTLMASLTAATGTPAVMDEAAAFAALDAFLVTAASPRIDQELISALGL